MFDHYLRKIKDQLAEPLARRMKNVNPNTLTLAGLVIGIGAAVFAYLGFTAGALLFWLLNRSLDGLDGLIARLHQKQDDFGGYLDILSDFFVYALLPISIVLGDPSQSRYLALIAMLASFYINSASWMYLAAIIEKRAASDPDKKTTIEMPSGLIGGFETIVFYGLFIVFPLQVTILFLTFTVLVIFTILQRFIWAKQQFRPTLLKGIYDESQHISARVYSEE